MVSCGRVLLPQLLGLFALLAGGASAAQTSIGALSKEEPLGEGPCALDASSADSKTDHGCMFLATLKRKRLRYALEELKKEGPMGEGKAVSMSSPSTSTKSSVAMESRHPTAAVAQREASGGGGVAGAIVGGGSPSVDSSMAAYATSAPKGGGAASDESDQIKDDLTVAAHEAEERSEMSEDAMNPSVVSHAAVVERDVEVGASDDDDVQLEESHRRRPGKLKERLLNKAKQGWKAISELGDPSEFIQGLGDGSPIVKKGLKMLKTQAGIDFMDHASKPILAGLPGKSPLLKGFIEKCFEALKKGD